VGAPETMKKYILLFAVIIVFITTCALWVNKGKNDAPLRILAQRNHLYIGTAVNGWNLTDPYYANTITREFNIITPENAMKFGPLSPAQGEYDFTEADAIVDFALENDLPVRGHVLVWTNQLPGWLLDRQWTRDELIEILRNHIFTVVGRYRGKIMAWDVVNETIADDGTFADNFWTNGIGPDYVEMAFRWAHEADPDALLFYNDFNAEGAGPKSDGVYTLVSGLVQNGVPIHGVGFEMHTTVDWAVDPAIMLANMQRLGALGLEIHITEMDVRIPSPLAPDALERQAEIYRTAMQACLEAPNCNTFIIWGLSDAHSWIPWVYPDWGAATILDEEYQPKPAYWAIHTILK